jgi:hypothetical protein
VSRTGKKSTSEDIKLNEAIQLMVRNQLMSRAALYQSMLDPTGRDLNKECGYPAEITIQMYKDMWEREGEGTRVVRCEPEASWGVEPSVYETESPDETPFEAAWKALLLKFNLFYHLYHIDELSGIGQFGVLLFGLNDGKDIGEPVPGVSVDGTNAGAKHDLIFLREFDESCVQVKTRERDKASPRYSLPTSYQINFTDASETGLQATQVEAMAVHWTRVLHVADGRTVSEVYGTPRMKQVFNRLLDIRKMLGGSAEMFWQGAFPGWSFEMNPDLADQGIQIDPTAIKEQVEKYANGLQRYMAIQGMQTRMLSPTVVDPSGHVDAHRKSIAISKSIPFRVLFGNEVGELASGQDMKAWNNRVARRQNMYVTPMIVRPFVDRLIAVGALPQPAEYLVDWPDLDTPTDDDKASVAVKKTQAMAAYVGGGVDQLMPPQVFFTQIMEMEQDQVDAIEEEALGQQEDQTEDGTVMPQFGPEPGVGAGTEPGGTTLPSAFNGAQVTAATGIVKDVTEGMLPRESGIGQLIVFFKLSREDAELVMGTAGTGATVKPNPGTQEPTPKEGESKNPFPVGNYDPSQPREPAGTSEGGQFASEGGGGGSPTDTKKKDAHMASAATVLKKYWKGNADQWNDEQRDFVRRDLRKTGGDIKTVKKHVAAMRGYVTDKYMEINASLKNRVLTKDVLFLADALEACPPVKAGSVVYRGGAGRTEDLVALSKVGGVWENESFTSSTLDKDAAWFFTSTTSEVIDKLDEQDAGPAVGYRMHWKDPLGVGRKILGGEHGWNSKESEIIYPPGTRFRILKAKKRVKSGRSYYDIECELLAE